MNSKEIHRLSLRSELNFFVFTFTSARGRFEFVRKFLFKSFLFNRVNINVEQKGRLVTFYHTVWDYPLIVACCLRVLATGMLYVRTQDGLASLVWSLPETLKGGAA